MKTFKQDNVIKKTNDKSKIEKLIAEGYEEVKKEKPKKKKTKKKSDKKGK